MMDTRHDPQTKRQAFTVIELLVSMTILTILLLLTSQIVGDVQKAWKTASNKVYQFRETRRAFDAVKRNLSMATLNPYLRYQYNNPKDPFSPALVNGIPVLATSAPLGWIRFSDLNFVCGPSSPLLTGATSTLNPGHALFFQAPIGYSSSPTVASANDYSTLSTGLNGRGYYVSFMDDSTLMPALLKNRKLNLKSRYRLMEFCPPTESNLVYSYTPDNTGTDPNTARYDSTANGNGALLDQTNYSTPGQASAATVQSAAMLNTSRWFNRTLGKDVNGAAVPLYRDNTYSHVLADNVIAMIVSPKVPVPAGSNTPPTYVAPNYYYNSSGFCVQGSSLSVLPDYAFQLPAEVFVAMVVIDEVSADKLCPAAQTAAQPPFATAWQATWFTNAANYQADMSAVEAMLIAQKLNYRIFSATVALKNARWNGLMQ